MEQPKTATQVMMEINEENYVEHARQAVANTRAKLLEAMLACSYTYHLITGEDVMLSTDRGFGPAQQYIINGEWKKR